MIDPLTFALLLGVGLVGASVLATLVWHEVRDRAERNAYHKDIK